MRALAILALVALAGCSRNYEAANNTYAHTEDVTMSDAPAANAMDMSMDANMSDSVDDGANAIENGAAILADGNTADDNAAAPADPLVYCDVTNERIPASDCAYNREARARLDQGRFAFDVPPRMIRGRAERVAFALTRPAEGHPEVIDNPADYVDNAPVRAAATRVGRRMAVRLDGEGFRIEPQGLIEKDLVAGGAARWDWTVTPLSGGSRRLTLSAYAIVRSANGERGEHLLKTLSQDVIVEVSRGDVTRDFMKESKGWFELSTEWLVALAALIGTGLFGLVVAIRKFRRRSAGGREGGGEADGGGDQGER